MIRKMSHATIFVDNQNEALEFYRDKLGFKVHTDAMVGEDFRWLTMCTDEGNLQSSLSHREILKLR